MLGEICYSWIWKACCHMYVICMYSMSYVCTVQYMYVICMYMYVICIYRVRVLVSFRNDIRKYIMLGEKKNKNLKTSVAAGLDPARSRLLVARFVSDPLNWPIRIKTICLKFSHQKQLNCLQTNTHIRNSTDTNEETVLEYWLSNILNTVKQSYTQYPGYPVPRGPSSWIVYVCTVHSTVMIINMKSK